MSSTGRAGVSTRRSHDSSRTRSASEFQRNVTLHEFVDLDIQSYGARQEALNSWQHGYAEVAEPGSDVVIVGDIDELPRSAVIGNLLSDANTLRELDDGIAFQLLGNTYYYHLGCRTNEDNARPILVSGEMLLHCGGGTVRDYAGSKQGPDRCIAKRLGTAKGEPRNNSWHLRYFMSAAQIHEAMCHGAPARSMVDAREWWNLKNVDPQALCHSPSTVKAAIHGCFDLWNRSQMGTAAPRSYQRDPPPEEQLPALLTQQMSKREGSLFAKWSSVHDLEEQRSLDYAASASILFGKYGY